MKNLLTSVFLSVTITLSGFQAAGQTVSTAERDQARVMAEEIAALMADLETRAAEFPDVLTQLEEGQIAIEQADQTVADLIQRLTEVTDAMEDGKPFAEAIDNYKDITVQLIAEAEGSDNEAIRGAVSGLRTTLEGLEQDDADRQSTVVDARNAIAQLEENREAIAFFIRAGQVQEAAALIAGEVDGFQDIVARGQAIADSLIDAATP